MKRITKILIMLLGIVFTIDAQWSNNPNINTPVCTNQFNQDNPVSISDGKGGVIIGWQDGRNSSSNVYSQRLDSNGIAQWSVDGIVVCDTNAQQNVKIFPDGAEGAMLFWRDSRSGNSRLYGQRINKNGISQWNKNGISVMQGDSGINLQNDTYGMVSLGNTNVLVARIIQSIIIFKLIDTSGATAWTDTIEIDANNIKVTPLFIESDGLGGAILSFGYQNSGTWGCYAQRINSEGTALWDSGVNVAIQNSDPEYFTLSSDNNGGAILLYQTTQVYGHRISASGTQPWGMSGKVITIENVNRLEAAHTGGNGWIVGWEPPFRRGIKIRLQYIDTSGAIQWIPEGIILTKVVNNGGALNLFPSQGGVLATWVEDVDPMGNGQQVFMYAQKIDLQGKMLWKKSNTIVCCAWGAKAEPAITEIGYNTYVFTWRDERNSYSDIYAQYITSAGVLSELAPSFLSLEDIQNDNGGKLRIKWTASASDIEEADVMSITQYGLWRKIPAGSLTLRRPLQSSFLVDDTIASNYDFITSVPVLLAD
ncbi:MAG: hypothetical protein HYZ34_06485 [Ignavibacteriae bacterium]|nr:hypothetical protein [Ignavibacteriota bacterium]